MPAGAALRHGARARHQALPVDDPPRLPAADLRAERSSTTSSPTAARRSRSTRRRPTCRRCRSSSRSPPSGSATHDPRATTTGTRRFHDGSGTLDFLFVFSGTSGDLGGGPRLPSNWIADFRRLYDFARGRAAATSPCRRGVQPRDADRHAARRPAANLPPGSFGGQAAAEDDPRAQPRLPQPHAGEDGQARDRASRWPTFLEGQGVNVSALTQGAAARRQTAARARRAHRRRSATALLERHAAVVLRPARGGAQRRAADGRRRADRRRDVPPRDGGQPASRSCATRRSAPDARARTDTTFRMVDLLLFAFEGKKNLLAPLG